MAEDKRAITSTEIIDMPQDKFEVLITEGKMSVGDASNLNFFLKSVYQRTVLEKDTLLAKVQNNEIKHSDVEHHLRNLYLLLMDLEKKVVFLNNYVKETMKTTC